jgi:Leucine-rich repeat (LRR) protein
LDHNEITTLDTTSFKGLKSLKDLRLNNNKISSIQTGIFNHLSKLEDLMLSGNEIEVVEKGSFIGMESLKLLNFHKIKNKTKTLSPKTIVPKSLEDLVLNERFRNDN